MNLVAHFARAVALAWAVFWLIFFIAESRAWNTPFSRMLPWLLLGLTFLAAAFASWRWERAGGVSLIALGALSALAYAISGPAELASAARVATFLAFGLPPVLSGALLLATHRH